MFSKHTQSRRIWHTSTSTSLSGAASSTTRARAPQNGPGWQHYPSNCKYSPHVILPSSSLSPKHQHYIINSPIGNNHAWYPIQNAPHNLHQDGSFPSYSGCLFHHCSHHGRGRYWCSIQAGWFWVRAKRGSRSFSKQRKLIPKGA